MEPDLLSKTEFLPIGEQGSRNPMDIADRIYDASRSYRRDHCAVFIDSDSAEGFLRDSGLPVSILDPQANEHWTGARRRKHSKLKRIVVGDYDGWFRWFMKWQRFNAFHIILLVAPVRRMVEDDRRGYFDGLLTRLLSKPSVHRVIVAEEERFQGTARLWMGGKAPPEGAQELEGEFGKEQFRHAVASLLYGTLISKRELSLAAAGTLYSRLNPTWESELLDVKSRPAVAEMVHRRFYTAGYRAKEMVESMETQAARESLEEGQQALPPLFRQAKDHGPSELSQEWLEGLTQSFLELHDWLTMAGLYEYINTETQRVIQTSDYQPAIFNDKFNSEMPGEMHVFVPSRPLLRRIAERLAGEGRVQTATWVREIGRPAKVYYLPGRLPFDGGNRCGQCAFYVPQRRQCRIWWLLNQSYGYRHLRWSRDGERPLSAFELHKMRNSWRIGPRSSACSKFVDKKKDHTRKTFPERCDACGGQLPSAPRKGQMAVCVACRTRYFMTKQSKVKVLTSYEHEFKRRYLELTNVDPASDVKRLIEERQSSAPAILEQAIYDEHRRMSAEDPDSAPKTVMVFPGDRMFARDGRLYIFKRRSVESITLAGSTLVDQGKVIGDEERSSLESAGMKVWSAPRLAGHEEAPSSARYDIAPAVERLVSSNPEFVRKMAIAMARSAVHATERIGALAEIPDDDVRAFTSKQTMLMRRLERAPPRGFLNYEAAIMKEYWDCYYLPLRAALQRSGPRKKARFVREFVGDPIGRARGYTAVDAAINYLHQRRLFKARSANVQLGLSFSPGEGFLHRKRWNAEGLGLVLDLIDPFKFADREKLIGAILNVSLNWRDFYSSTDRHGAQFYYPRPEAVGVLEAVGEAADRMLVSYHGAQLSLLEAYQATVSMLIQKLRDGTPTSFTPYVY